MNESLNDYLWEYHTRKAAVPYMEKLLSLVDGDSTRLITTLHGDPYEGYYVYTLDSFPIPGYPKGRYDFMIEFGMKHPSIGIYYGVRSVAEWGSDPLEAIRISDIQWEEVRLEVTEVLNATFPDLDFSLKFKLTDNADSLTYWPFWLSLESGEDIRDVAVRALMLIRNTYARHFNIRADSFPEILSQTREEDTRTRFTTVAYNKLQQRLAHNLKVEVSSVRSLFDKFIEKAIEKGWVERDLRLEYAFRFNTFCGLSQTSGCAIMLTGLMECLNTLMLRQHNSKAYVPWEAFSGILLNSEGHIITSEALKTKITKRYQRNMTSTDAEIKKAADTIARMLA